MPPAARGGPDGVPGERAGRIFVPRRDEVRAGIQRVVFGAGWPPGSPEFLDGARRLVERAARSVDLMMMVFPDEGDAPLAANSFARTRRSFADGRWFTEATPRAVVARLDANPDLVGLLYYQDEGVLLGTPRTAGFTAGRLARLLDRAPDQGTTTWLLAEIALLSYALADEYHALSADSARLAWFRELLP
jgi:hypothetical protein